MKHYGTESQKVASINSEEESHNDEIPNEIEEKKFLGTGKPTLGAVFLFTTATLGAGVLNLPNVLKQTGILIGIAMIFGVACLSVSSLTLLLKCHQMIMKINPKLVDYEDMAYYCFGPIASLGVKICVILINFGAAVAYLIILGNLLKPILALITSNEILLRTEIIILIICVPMILISMVKTMSDLKIITYLSFSCVLAFVLYVVITYKKGYVIRRGEVKLYNFGFGILKVLGTVMFSYSCHTSLCPINKDYDEEGSKEVSGGIVGSVFLCSMIYTIVGFFGYMSFGENVKGSLLDSFDSSFYNLLFRGFYCFVIFFTYPVALYPFRISVENLFKDFLSLFQCYRDLKTPEGKVWTYVQTYANGIKIILLTSFLGGLTVLLAIVAQEKIEYVFSLTGAVASTFSDYVFPGLFYLKLTKNGWFHPYCLLAYLVILFGVVCGPVATVITFLGFFNIV